MSSLILRTAVRLLLPLLLLVSVFLLLRGHDEPGGGFIGGLLAASALALVALARGPRAALRAVAVDPRSLAGAGLALCVGAGIAGLLAGEGLLAGLWLPVTVPGVGKLSSVLLFDVGVYLVVLGAALLVLVGTGEESG